MDLAGWKKTTALRRFSSSNTEAKVGSPGHLSRESVPSAMPPAFSVSYSCLSSLRARWLQTV